MPTTGNEPLKACAGRVQFFIRSRADDTGKKHPDRRQGRLIRREFQFQIFLAPTSAPQALAKRRGNRIMMSA